MNIGFIGAPGAGKDELARFLVSEYGYKRLAFADKIKELYYSYSGITEKEFKSSRHTDREAEIRKGLWEYSDKMRKEFNSLYFVNPVVEEMRQSERPVVISDIRTVDELNEVEKSGAEVILVARHSNSQKIIDLSIPGTRISEHRVRSCRVFHNNLDGLDKVFATFDVFYNDLIRELSVRGDALGR